MEDYLIETIEHEGYTIKIYTDTDPLNPRTDYDNFGTMVCFHSRYDLGDEAGNKHNIRTLEELLEHIKETNAVALPLYLYDHSGITMRTDPTMFRACDSAGWDWGKVGLIFATREQILQELGGKRLSRGKKKRAVEMLKSEVETYDNYLTGNVHGFVIEDPDGEETDSCWGFNGDPKWAIEDAKAVVNSAVKRAKEEQRQEYLRRKQNWERGIPEYTPGQMCFGF